MTPDPPDLWGLPPDALATRLPALGVAAHHATPIFRALHHGQSLRDHPQIGPRIADRLQPHSAPPTLTVRQRHPSPDGTLRLVLGLDDDAEVEAVLVPMAGQRTTLCLSSQVGCAMACRFCATGTLGLTRHLRASEIVGQLAVARAVAAERARTVDRVVFMGMGEPLHHIDATLRAIGVFTHPAGPGLSGRRITVSTVGLVDRLARFADETSHKIGLALSLHAGTDATRARIIPLARTTSLAALRRALRDHPRLRRRTLMAEYVLLPGVNDLEAEADGVAAFADGLKIAINLLPFNPFARAPFRAPTHAELERFAHRLKARGLYVTVRTPKGRSVDGACGQLALRRASSRSVPVPGGPSPTR